MIRKYTQKKISLNTNKLSSGRPAKGVKIVNTSESPKIGLLESREIVQNGMKKHGVSGLDMRKLIKEIRNGKKN